MEKMEEGSTFELLNQKRIALAQNSIDFYLEHAFDPERKTFYSDLDRNGNRLSNKTHLVALSRLIYGLAKASVYNEQYLPKAEMAAKFLLDSMLKQDQYGPYFASTYIPDTGAIAPTTLGIWEQSYGFCGLVELYRFTKDASLLEDIHMLFEGYKKRFKDELGEGCFDTYSLENKNEESTKSYQSTIYPLSSFLINLWEVDEANRASYEPWITEHLILAKEKIWNPKSKWVNVNFNNNWERCNGQDTLCFEVSPGHNFQLAWLLMCSGSWTFIPPDQAKANRELGKQILAYTLEQPIWDEGVQNGFFETIDPNNQQILSRRKSWWQHCEAIIACSFAQESYKKELQQLESFFVQSFPDYEYGNEFFYLDENNQPIKEVPKGSLGKSVYHTVEMVAFLLSNQ